MPTRRRRLPTLDAQVEKGGRGEALADANEAQSRWSIAPRAELLSRGLPTARMEESAATSEPLAPARHRSRHTTVARARPSVAARYSQPHAAPFASAGLRLAAEKNGLAFRCRGGG